MDPTLSLISPAKLNLFLHINGRRGPDQVFPGYHELQSIFQILDRGDIMHFTRFNTMQMHDTVISLSPDFPDIPLEDNLICRAANALKNSLSQPQDLAHIHIKLEKNIPMGGGLGGGSSNAATTLLALNHLWRLDYSEDQLAAIGAKLGADVPIFVRAKSAWAEGIGERITPLSLPEKWFVILAPGCHINTREIFSHQRLTRDTPKLKIAPALGGQDYDKLAGHKIAFSDQLDSNSSYDDFIKHCHNDCEPLVSQLYPEVRLALDWLNNHSPSRMTGTGACCFASFENEAKAKQVLNEAQSKFKGFIAKGVNLSPAIKGLTEAKCSQRTQ